MSSLADPNPANDSRRLASAAANSSDTVRMSSASQLQFIVMGHVNNLSFQANSSDTVRAVLERIYRITKIPVIGKTLIYKEKQLKREKSLAECAIRNDAVLQLVGQMRSPAYFQAWGIIEDMISLVCRLCEGKTVPDALQTIRTKISEFLSMTPKDDANSATTHLRIFMALSAHKALLELYMSPIRGNKEHAVNSIKHFLESCITELPKSLRSHCAPIVLRFCEMLRKIAPHVPLYLTCRSSLGSMMEVIKVQWVSGRTKSVKRVISIKEIFPFVKELAYKLSRDMEASLISTASMGSWRDVEDFSMFLRPLLTVMSGYKGFDHPIPLPMENEHRDVLSCKEEVESLHKIFQYMLKKMYKCLSRMQECSSANVSGEIDIAYPAWSRYLTILKELNAISKLYLGSEEKFWRILSRRKRALCMLVVRYAKRNDDHKWLLEHKDIMDFESRRHLVMMMFPEVKEDFEDRLEMLIDRSQLLSESLEYIANAEAESLRGSILMEFKNEAGTGPGVMREWVVLVCQAIFNQENHLFVACPSDRRRFYPNPASTVDSECLKNFNFYGRMIGLALMHKVQVGIVLDRVFFLQLGGYSISLEDIRDADPDMYNRWKQILEMDAESIDSSPLRLPFIGEIEELRLRRDLELCDDGLNMLVNSKNRNDYVDLLIKHQFVTSISQQVSHFAQGFGDILSNLRLQKFFFQSLELEDIDQMLHGGENDISVEDWKAHTEYNEYKSSDDQIDWFWKIVSEMSPQQKRNILFYWTSVKYLPVEGFRGLGSRLYIYKSMEMDHLPSAHTCFYRLCFPPYPNMTIMQQRLSFIAQGYVACSFGIQ